ncbi:hypothetical protein RHSIM_Rhsim03G0183600 [Rhododendron simsii]|uniref:Glycosyl transferase CAP10 domain-containing protein n=1 Tax=Rhododendron simsii TaxID=118357 RepID=A0A834HAF9_RHOSS|nr:hypothetical protein RHSIM_Rhsim03G0184100 [Rhododendron simsii]KAF7148925.1 hypothetical protein RHSIM_Rhsim03G0183600 [Rhododendron simsii]
MLGTVPRVSGLLPLDPQGSTAVEGDGAGSTRIYGLVTEVPEKIPDLDLMFNWADMPVIKSMDYSGPNATAPPPLFRYCEDDAMSEIIFPDWTFWGWIGIKKNRKGSSNQIWPASVFTGIRCTLKELDDQRVGNTFLHAQEIGKAGSDFTQEDLKMDYVYDYMFHLLNEYAKLMR